VKSHKQSMAPDSGITGPNGTLKPACPPERLRKTGTARQVTKYVARRATTLIIASQTNVPEIARIPPIPQKNMMEITGVP